ncbi:MAG: hypothetical protein R3D33_05150 [Hyphomicrobiaceae bacterium]
MTEQVEASAGETATAGVAEVVRPAGPRTIYKTGAGMKFWLTAAMLLLGFFFVAMVATLVFWLSHGILGNALTLAIAIAIYGVCLLLLIAHVVYTYRKRVDLGETAVGLCVPVWRGSTPTLSYVKRKIPYDQVAAVETRGEIYKAAGVPTLLKAACVVTKDGERIHLGYQHETSEDSSFKVGEIAEEIARRAGVPVSDKGIVRVGSHAVAAMHGTTPPWDKAGEITAAGQPVTAEQYERMISGNHKLMYYIAFVVLGLALLGFVVDLGQSGYLN